MGQQRKVKPPAAEPRGRAIEKRAREINAEPWSFMLTGHERVACPQCQYFYARPIGSDQPMCRVCDAPKRHQR